MDHDLDPIDLVAKDLAFFLLAWVTGVLLGVASVVWYMVRGG